MERRTQRFMGPQQHGRRVCLQRGLAFTLVELLVVIGIIAVLISILLPALTKVRAAGMQTACLSNLRTMGQALSMYVAESKGQLPSPPYRDDDTTTPQAVPIHVMLYSRLYKTAPIQNGDRSVFRCPAMRDTEANFSTATSNFGKRYPQSGTNPIDFAGMEFIFINSYAFSEGASYWRNANELRYPTKISQIKRSAEYIYAFDGRGTFRIDDNFKSNPNMSAAIRNNIQIEIDDHLILRHGPRAQSPRTMFQNANALYLDGHASSGVTGYNATTNPGGVSAANTDWRRRW